MLLLLPLYQTIQRASAGILTCVLIWGCAATSDLEQRKIKGISLEGPSAPSKDNVMDEMKGTGADMICLMPYAYMKTDSSRVQFDQSQWQWWGERTEGTEALINQCYESGMQVMLKPHLWIGWGAYTGDLSFDSTELQMEWDNSYREYVIHFARIAERKDVALFCIGTELCQQVSDRPEFWKDLIHEVRSIYHGKLTYASNWDCYQGFPLWEELDYIGIDGYFPLSEKDEPSLEEAQAGWSYWKAEMARFSRDQDRPILFTEYGYRSVSFGLKEPWEMSRKGKVDYEIQNLGYQALFSEIWDEDWFAGGFLWKWHCAEHLKKHNKENLFSPQGKPALEIVKEKYGAQFLKKE